MNVTCKMFYLSITFLAVSVFAQGMSPEACEIIQNIVLDLSDWDGYFEINFTNNPYQSAKDYNTCCISILQDRNKRRRMIIHVPIYVRMFLDPLFDSIINDIEMVNRWLEKGLPVRADGCFDRTLECVIADNCQAEIETKLSETRERMTLYVNQAIGKNSARARVFTTQIQEEVVWQCRQHITKKVMREMWRRTLKKHFQHNYGEELLSRVADAIEEIEFYIKAEVDILAVSLFSR